MPWSYHRAGVDPKDVPDVPRCPTLLLIRRHFLSAHGGLARGRWPVRLLCVCVLSGPSQLQSVNHISKPGPLTLDVVRRSGPGQWGHGRGSLALCSHYAGRLGL